MTGLTRVKPMGRQSRLEKRQGRKVHRDNTIAFSAHAVQRWATRGPGTVGIQAAFQHSRFLGRWTRFYLYEYADWIFFTTMPRAPDPEICVTVWPRQWWRRWQH